MVREVKWARISVTMVLNIEMEEIRLFLIRISDFPSIIFFLLHPRAYYINYENSVIAIFAK